MGCDIHCYAERKSGDRYEAIIGARFASDYNEPFSSRSYGVFGFLANVRNYSDIPPIADPRGYPADMSEYVSAEQDVWSGDAHSASWLTVKELSEFDYDRFTEDRRVTRATAFGLDGGCTAEPGGGVVTTYKEFLGEAFFRDMQTLRDVGADRIVFWFDN